MRSALENPLRPLWENGVDRSRLESLSARERQVLEMAAAGLIDKEIGSSLGVSLNTLRTYWSRIRLKVGEGSRAALAAAYAEENMANSAAQSDRLLAEDWELDLETGLITASDPINREYGLAPGVAHPRSAYQRFYHPEDREAAIQAWQEIARSSSDLHQITYRRIMISGVRLVSIFVRVIRDDSGKAIKLRGHRVSNRDFRPDRNPEVRIGFWRRNLASDQFWADRECRWMLRLDSGDEITREDMYTNVHPDFQSLARQFVDLAAAAGEDSASADIKLRFSNSEESWVRTDASIEYEDGIAVRVAGIILAFE